MMVRDTAEVMQSMQPAWFKDINKRKRRKGGSRDGRTLNEECFDSGVFAAAEFVRRVTRDEHLALAVHEVCIWQQRKREAEVCSLGLPAD